MLTLQRKDYSTCFCAEICKCVNQNAKLIFGRGTVLTALSRNVVKPSIYKVGDSCLATDFTRHTAVDDDPAFTGQNLTARYEGESTYSSFALGTGDSCEEKNMCNKQHGDIEGDEKMNFMSLGIFWLRILFLKTVVFNVLMTVKAWMS